MWLAVILLDKEAGCQVQGGLDSLYYYTFLDVWIFYFLFFYNEKWKHTQYKNILGFLIYFLGFELFSLDMFLEVESPGGIFYNSVEYGKLH